MIGWLKVPIFAAGKVIETPPAAKSNLSAAQSLQSPNIDGCGCGFIAWRPAHARRFFSLQFPQQLR
jgi:hypothetical protein